METTVTCADTRPGAFRTGLQESGGPEVAERRRYPRMNHYFPITFSPDGGPGTSIIGAGVTVNISRGGIFFVMSDTRLFPGMRVRGAIMARSSGLDGGVIEFAARVQRVSTFALGGRTVEATVGVAVQFDNPMGGLGLEAVRNPAPWDVGTGSAGGPAAPGTPRGGGE